MKIFHKHALIGQSVFLEENLPWSRVKVMKVWFQGFVSHLIVEGRVLSMSLVFHFSELLETLLVEILKSICSVRVLKIWLDWSNRRKVR